MSLGSLTYVLCRSKLSQTTVWEKVKAGIYTTLESSYSWQFPHLGKEHIIILPQSDCILNRLDSCHYRMAGEGYFIDGNAVEGRISWLSTNEAEAEVVNVTV